MYRAYVMAIFLLACFRMAMPVELAQGGCSCAVFSTSPPNNPLIEHKLSYNVSCNKEGTEKCRLLCIALAQGAKEQAPVLICETLNRHVENFKVSVYTRACDADTWIFTGLESEAICCHEGKEMACEEATTVPSE